MLLHAFRPGKIRSTYESKKRSDRFFSTDVTPHRMMGDSRESSAEMVVTRSNVSGTVLSNGNEVHVSTFLSRTETG